MDIKKMFGDEKLSYADFTAKLDGAKLDDVSGFVSKEKYDAQVTVAKDWKTKHKALSDSVDGDEGYKTKLTQLEKDLADGQVKIDTLEADKTSTTRNSILSKAGVGEKYTKFALNEISSLVNDTTDFNSAMTNWKKDNEQFFEDAKPATEKGGTFTFNQPTGTNKSVSGSKDTGSQMNSVLKGALK